MKKYFSFFMLIFILAGINLSFAKDKAWKLTNITGSSLDNCGGRDFLVFDYDDSLESISFSEQLYVFDRITFDYKTPKFATKLRLETLSDDALLEEDDTLIFNLDTNIEFKGYARYSPIPQVSLYAGNSFFNEFALRGSELKAFDDSVKWGKILRGGIGLSTDFIFGREKNISLKLAAGVNSKFLYGDDTVLFSFGQEFKIKNVMSFGTAFSNISIENRKIAAFASVDAIKNAALNFGYVYNNNDTDFLPSKTKHSLQASAGYKLKDIKLSFYADYITALTNEYIKASTGDTKYYDYGASPYAFALRSSFSPFENLKIQLQYKLQGMRYLTDSARNELFPSMEYKFLHETFEVASGLRFVFDKSVGSGLTTFSVPVTLKITL